MGVHLGSNLFLVLAEWLFDACYWYISKSSFSKSFYFYRFVLGLRCLKLVCLIWFRSFFSLYLRISSYYFSSSPPQPSSYFIIRSSSLSTEYYWLKLFLLFIWNFIVPSTLMLLGTFIWYWRNRKYSFFSFSLCNSICCLVFTIGCLF